jgi:hypothetical protein
MTTLIRGIHQSDIILQSAMRLGLKELRDTPTLIDDMLAGLLDDPLTEGKYGNVTIQQCKDWFASTRIVVRLGLSIDTAQLPMVAIGLGSAPESEATFSDIHYDVSEPNPWVPGQYRRLHSVLANENYEIAAFVHGEPEYALFLYSMCLFVLLRRKEDLLEARGFELSGFQVGALQQAPTEQENIFTRSITVSGKVRHSWPGIKVGGEVEDVVVNLPTEEIVGTENEIMRIADLATLMDQDMLLGVKPSSH